MYIGISNDKSVHGKKLKQGGTCIIYKDKISIAISEERLTREKASGGYARSLSYCLDSLSASESDIKIITTSSCCDYQAETSHFKSKRNQLLVNNHHFSHALSSFYCSSFDEAIVIIMDGGGNTLSDNGRANWWECSREQVSIYIANGNDIKLIKRLFDKPFDIGYGEMFRCVTKYLGFGSAENVGKVMALAGCYNGAVDANFDIFDPKNKLVNNPLEPLAAIDSFISLKNLSIKPRLDNSDIKEDHIYLAYLIQKNLQDSLLKVVDDLIQRTGIKNFCFSGGVALNCIANTFILNNSNIKRLFIQPAANDSGQCVGNAIFSYLKEKPKDVRFDMSNCYLGREYSIEKSDIINLISIKYRKLSILSFSKENTILYAADLLSKMNVIGFFSGKSEFGPRALGNRSILASPSCNKLKEYINCKVKCRESFMPLAASVMKEFASDYFEGDISKFMSLAPIVKPSMRSKISAVVHSDNSCRAQSVDKADNPYFYQLLDKYYSITNVPVLLNTSMNARGMPIVETLEDALLWFDSSPLEYLVVNEFIMGKFKAL
ncbi:carbamoyltransferase C-terminal domain-containing protein [Shewanella oncorhynchi]|uniref:carbamoyltransferase C-terminal domain-containing protein n=1 Tax=Shewanella oncorhynchi TaxID=2726434 RepID=UPI003D7A13AF